ncbi:hypothetical protein [Bacillus sp. JJ783]|uniref:hypothetical protein n=1 Tax=Bacillus sp. JJ783 TaxID=3122974 RepID=UPI003003854E
MDRKEFVAQIGANHNVSEVVSVNKTFKSQQYGYFTFDQMRLVEEGLISASTFTVFCWMISRPKKWTFRKYHMYDLFSRKIVDKAFKELIEVGYLVVVNHGKGKASGICVRVFAERQSPLKMKQYATRMIQKLRSQGKKDISISELQWNFFSSQHLELDNTECADWENTPSEDWTSEEVSTPAPKEDKQVTVFDIIDGLTLDVKDVNRTDNTEIDEYEDYIPLGYANKGNKIIHADKDGRPTNKAVLPSQIIPEITYDTSKFGQTSFSFRNNFSQVMESYLGQTMGVAQ